MNCRGVFLAYHGALFGGIWCIDIVTKMFAVMYAHHPISLIPGVWLEVAYNTGGMLSVFHDYPYGRYIMYVIQACVIGYVMMYAASSAFRCVSAWAATAIAAGGSVNLFLRCIHHGVVDFIVIGIPPYIWPPFNCADIAIVLGVLCMVISSGKEQA